MNRKYFPVAVVLALFSFVAHSSLCDVATPNDPHVLRTARYSGSSWLYFWPANILESGSQKLSVPNTVCAQNNQTAKIVEVVSAEGRDVDLSPVGVVFDDQGHEQLVYREETGLLRDMRMGDASDYRCARSWSSKLMQVSSNGGGAPGELRSWSSEDPAEKRLEIFSCESDASGKIRKVEYIRDQFSIGAYLLIPLNSGRQALLYDSNSRALTKVALDGEEPIASSKALWSGNYYASDVRGDRLILVPFALESSKEVYLAALDMAHPDQMRVAFRSKDLILNPYVLPLGHSPDSGKLYSVASGVDGRGRLVALTTNGTHAWQSLLPDYFNVSSCTLDAVAHRFHCYVKFSNAGAHEKYQSLSSNMEGQDIRLED